MYVESGIEMLSCCLLLLQVCCRGSLQEPCTCVTSEPLRHWEAYEEILADETVPSKDTKEEGEGERAEAPELKPTAASHGMSPLLVPEWAHVSQAHVTVFTFALSQPGSIFAKIASVGGRGEAVN